MPHLNEMHKKFAARGLTILALTDEANVDAFVKEHSIVYPVGMGSGGTGQAYGVQGIPQCYLIGANGKVVFEGHSVSEALIEQELAKASVLPDREWPKPVDKAAGLVKQRKPGKAWKELEKLSDLEGDAKTAADELRKFIEDGAALATATVDELEKSGDLFAAYEEAKRGEEAYDGHPAGKAFEDKRKGWEKDKEAKKVIKAGMLFAEAQKLEQKKDYKKALPLYIEAARAGEGTKIGELAKARAEALSKNY